MADFTSDFWSWYIIVLTVTGIVGLFVLLIWMSKHEPTGEQPQSMGHVWDEDLEELNNPLPLWWLVMFYITLIFGIAYLILYPGLGNVQGLLGWTQKSEYEEEIKVADAAYGPLFEQYSHQDLVVLSKNPEAIKTGERLFINYCATCHGSDARGARGFPNLRDADWLYGGDAETIKTTIMDGRDGNMPPWEAVLSNDDVKNITEYIINLSGRRADSKAVRAGEAKFEQFCVACHNADGKGMHVLGAPNLADDVWLYGGSKKSIMASILKGRQGRMPAHKDFLGEAKVHLLAAYIYKLSDEIDDE